MTAVQEASAVQEAPARTGTLEIAPSAGYIGAEIGGVDLRDDLDQSTVEEIRAALHRYKVVFFRDQEIGHAEQVAFAHKFGKVTPAHPHEENPPEGFPEILPIDSRRYTQNLGRKRTSYDHSWHTDVTALVNPPAASILRADILPPYGGDTAWTNLVAAYEGLPKELRELADRLGVKRSLRELGMPEDGIEVAVAQTMAAPYWNPRPLDSAMIRALMVRAWRGEPPGAI